MYKEIFKYLQKKYQIMAEEKKEIEGKMIDELEDYYLKKSKEFKKSIAKEDNKDGIFKCK